MVDRISCAYLEGCPRISFSGRLSGDKAEKTSSAGSIVLED